MSSEKRDINDTISLRLNRVIATMNRISGMHDLEKMREILTHSTIVKDLLNGTVTLSNMDTFNLCRLILKLDTANIEDNTGVDLIKMIGDNYYNGKKRDKEKQKGYKNSKGSRSKVQR